MKKIEQIRNKYDIITEKQDTDARKLEALARSGLFESKKIPVLKRALEKEPEKMTIAERKVVLELLDSLISEAVYSQNLNEAKEGQYLTKYDPRFDNSAAVSERDLPTIIILKRKGIRVFSGNQKIGLYYSQYLDRYISIPFGPGVPSINEAANYKQAYQDYVKDYGDEGDDKKKKEKSPEELRKFVLQKAGEGKIRAKHYLTGPKILGGDPEKIELKKASNKYLKDKFFSGQVTGLDALAAKAGVAHGAAFRKFVSEPIRDKLRQLRGKNKTTTSPAASPEPPKPTTPTTPTTPTGGSPASSTQPSLAGVSPPKNTSVVRQAKVKSGKATRARMAKIKARNPDVQFSQAAMKQAALKEAFMNRLMARRQINESESTAVKLAPHILKRTAPAIAAMAAPILAPVAGAIGAGLAVGSIASQVKNPENRKKAEINRAGEAAAGAAYDAKKAQLKRQRADDRDAAEVAAHSGLNPKNRPAKQPAVVEPAKTNVSDFAKIDHVTAPATPVPTSVSAPAEPVVSAPAAENPPAPMTVAAPAVAPPKAIDKEVADAAAVAMTQTRATAGTKADANVATQAKAPKGRNRPGGKKPPVDVDLPSKRSPDTSDSERKPLTPASFGLKIKIHEPKGNISTGVDKRLSNLYRKSFENPSLNEVRGIVRGVGRGIGRGLRFIDAVAGDLANSPRDDDGTKTLSPTEFDLKNKIKVSAPSRPDSLRTGVDARLRKYERDYYSQQQQNESILKSIKKMVSEGTTEMQLNIGENSITINNTIAQKIVSVHESLNKDNKKQMENMLSESVESFKKIVNFAVRQ